MLTEERELHTWAGATLCPARLEDVPALVALDEACFGARSWTAAAWREAVLEASWTALVLRVQGEVAGASVLLLWPPVAHIASIAVHPRHQRAGFGTLLLRDAVTRARRAGARWASLEVDADSEAVRLYRREGFGVLRRFREDGLWRLTMVRRFGGLQGI
jgi:ribosomal-protein-alanine N-acetyltransferase